MPWTGGKGQGVTGKGVRQTWTRKSTSRHSRSKEFDTLGTWDTRLNVAIDEAAMLKTGQVYFNTLFMFRTSLTGGAKH